MANSRITINRIFYISVSIGLCGGVSIMYLLNGILGHMPMIEAFLAFLSFAGVGAFALFKILKILIPFWLLPISADGNEENKHQWMGIPYSLSNMQQHLAVGNVFKSGMESRRADHRIGSGIYYGFDLG